MKKQYRMVIEERSEDTGYYHTVETIKFKADALNLSKLIDLIKSKIKLPKED